MPDFKLRRCDRCNKYHASYVVEDPQRGKINLCTHCWNAENRRLQPAATTATVQSALANSPKKIPRLDRQILLAHVLGQPRAWVLAHPEAPLTEAQTREWKAALAHLRRGDPLPYVLGRWEFYGLEFIVTPEVLIPRPETELMVEQALSWLHARLGAGGASACRAVDVGCGSGCVAIALAANTPGLQVTAVDLSPQALEVARRNVELHGLAGRVTLVQADLLPQQPPIFDLICANLPYIPREKLDDLPVAHWEPPLALDGGPDGLALIRRLLRQTPAHLAPGGLLLLEIESSQGPAALLLAQEAFPRARVDLLQDLAGLDRLVRVELVSF